MGETLGRACQAMAQTSFRLRTGALPVPTAFMPPLRRVLEEACAPSPLPDSVLIERVLATLCMALIAADPAPAKLPRIAQRLALRATCACLPERPIPAKHQSLKLSVASPE